MKRTSGVPSLQEDGPSAKESVRGMLHGTALLPRLEVVELARCYYGPSPHFLTVVQSGWRTFLDPRAQTKILIDAVESMKARGRGKKKNLGKEAVLENSA